MNLSEDFSAYVCPTCKAPPALQPQALYCAVCGRSYPLVEGIPDFLAPEMEGISDPLIQRMDRADRGALKWMSGLYESSIWYPFVISVFLGRNATSLDDLSRRIRAAINFEQGRVLDAACGTATFSRRVAAAGRPVFGIDISMAMLQRGTANVRSEGAPGGLHVSLARARVERLPFADNFFDFAICSGALHLFPDTLAALTDIGRTLKTGGRLVGLTFLAGSHGMVRYAWYRAGLKKRGKIRLFQLPELETCFRQAGFELLEPQFLGSGVFFTAQKG